jgi:hypothetical protein
MEKLLTATIEVGIEEPHTLCGGALENLSEDLILALTYNLNALTDLIRGKFSNEDGIYKDGGEGKIKITFDLRTATNN